MIEDWIELPLAGFPGELLKIRTTTKWSKEAEARYELDGKRLHGVIRIRYARYEAPRGKFAHVHLGYGGRTDHYSTWRGGYHYNDPPIFNGARLGSNGVVTEIADLLHDAELTPRGLGARRDYPELAGRRFIAAVRTIVRHWAARPDMDTARRVAAVHQAIPVHRDMIWRQRALADRIDKLTGEYAQLEEALAPIKVLCDQNDTLLTDLGIASPATQSNGRAQCP